MTQVKHFSDVIAWQKAYSLALEVYNMTEWFPKHEQFGLAGQMRRAVVSVCSNIAEGFGRNSAREKDYFYNMAAGSLSEVENQILIARGVHYIQEYASRADIEHCVEAHRVLAGLQKTNKMKGAGATL